MHRFSDEERTVQQLQFIEHIWRSRPFDSAFGLMGAADIDRLPLMTKIRFEPAEFDVEVDAPISLIDVSDEHPDTDVPYSCRSASCGACRVEVLEGAEGLLPPDEDELEVLRIFEDGPGIRLCCQLELVKDVERLHLRVVDPL